MPPSPDGRALFLAAQCFGSRLSARTTPSPPRRGWFALSGLPLRSLLLCSLQVKPRESP